MKDAIIRAEALRFSYTSAEGVAPVVLDGVDLTIREGSFNICISCNRPDLGDMLPPLKSLILKWGLLAQWLY